MDRKSPKTSYDFKKLFKMMIDKGISKKELADAAGISYSSLSRLANNQLIHLDSMLSICKVLNCKIDDVIECNDINSNGGKEI